MQGHTLCGIQMHTGAIARGAFGVHRPQLLTRVARHSPSELSDQRHANSKGKYDRCTKSTRICASSENSRQDVVLTASTSSALALWLFSALPAFAEDTVDFSKGGFAKESYYVTLGLFLISLPGKYFRSVEISQRPYQEPRSVLLPSNANRKGFQSVQRWNLQSQGFGPRSKERPRRRK